MPRTLKTGQPGGSKHPRAKLTEEDVLVIRRRLAAGDRQADIAQDFNISPSQVSRIKNGSSWGGRPISSPERRGSDRASAKLTEEDIPVILHRINLGDSLSAVARAYGVGRTTIADIWYGRRWTHVPRPQSVSPTKPQERRPVYDDLYS